MYISLQLNIQVKCKLAQYTMKYKRIRVKTVQNIYGKWCLRNFMPIRLNKVNAPGVLET